MHADMVTACINPSWLSHTTAAPGPDLRIFPRLKALSLEEENILHPPSLVVLGLCGACKRAWDHCRMVGEDENVLVMMGAQQDVYCSPQTPQDIQFQGRWQQIVMFGASDGALLGRWEE